ncbi:ADP/ATP-dependent (S)-NAD(P)H-hydrate dehydratase [uncultured Microbacterium sp.]|uniref:ADP-dependent NAD(P)H-hydrate dehydratase n=1 Tax=uncultured Microbacterium sp. TaxID=191216 RepID=UPI0025FC9D10|nr:ADP/ATP-dependent (S)-NAD(P)H-hydrate dehydratase [uncultured Microbacterium sp.]
MTCPSDGPVDAATLREWGLPVPGRTKQSRGDAVVVGASRRTPGAVMLALEAALRVGAGRVATLVPGSVDAVIGAQLPEAAVFALPEDAGEPIDGAAATALEHADAVLVGPGFDDVAETRATLMAVVKSGVRRLVLDAYALAVLDHVPRGALPRDLVLTPNEDELRMLTHTVDGDDIDLGRLVVKAARRFDATIAAYGLVGTPDGALLSVEGGGPGLATAGSGDALAGAGTGFLARGLPSDRACAWALWAHARAGDRLTVRRGLGFLARELVGELADAVHDVQGTD